MSKYPYPVLCENDSSYKSDVNFRITYFQNKILNGKIFCELDVDMNSEYLNELISDNKAKMYIKLQTNIDAFIVPVQIENGKCYVEVSVDKLQRIDYLRFVGYVLTNGAVELKYHPEMLDIYQGEYIIKLKNKDILAISNMEILSYSTTNNDFIKFSVSDELKGKGYKITIHENFVNITIGQEFNVAYGRVKTNKKDVCLIFDSHLIFEVFVYVLISFSQNYEEHSEKEVYKIIEQIFIQSTECEDFKLFLEDIKRSDCLEIELIYEAAHKMVNNQIENSIISASKMEA